VLINNIVQHTFRQNVIHRKSGGGLNNTPYSPFNTPMQQTSCMCTAIDRWLSVPLVGFDQFWVACLAQRFNRRCTDF